MAAQQFPAKAGGGQGLALPYRIEWLSVIMIVLTYGAWIGLLAIHDWLPWPVLGVLGGSIVCLHGSLQHEIIHGHPTPWRRLNHALVCLPISLWLPFEIYRRSHLDHHLTRKLTCPHQDPESAYVDAESWASLPRALQYLLYFNQTMLGRVTVGPIIICSRFWWRSLRKVITGQDAERGVWLRHGIAVGALLGLMQWIFAMPPWLYLVLFTWPGVSLTLVRSFAEHHRAGDEGSATAVVQSRGPLALLFLYNNYHWWHHRFPGVPWYRLPRLAAQRAEALPRDVITYSGYANMWRRFGVRRRDNPWHDAGAT